jgi:hypothetical protein
LFLLFSALHAHFHSLAVYLPALKHNGPPAFVHLPLCLHMTPLLIITSSLIFSTSLSWLSSFRFS